MSLDFNTSKIKPKVDGSDPVRTKDGDLTGLAQTVIFMSMFVDLGEITPKTADAFFGRANLYEHALGAMRKNKDGSDLFLTLEEVRSMIGLTTNVANKTEKAFRTKLGTLVVERLERKLRANV